MTDAPPSPPPSESQPQPQPQPQPSHDDAASPTTVPEGLRATQLRKVFVRALSKSVGTCTYDNFAACFPTTARNQPRLLQALWKQVIELWRTRAMKEFDAILAARDVVPRLNALDGLIAAARRDRSAAGPNAREPMSVAGLKPVQVVEAHVLPVIAQAVARVEGRLEGVRGENDVLMAEIEERRREVGELVGVLESEVGQWEGAVTEVWGLAKVVEGEQVVE